MQFARRAAAGAVVVFLAASTSLLLSTTASAAVPTDPASSGTLTLCGPTGHPVVGGVLDTSPFVWKAVGYHAAPSGYSGPGQTADLLIFQVRPDVPASDWSGDQLTAGTKYDASANPVAQATSKDISLGVITQEFPPMGDGYYELRMYFAKIDYGNTSSHYPAAFIQVKGDSWRLVSGGGGSCAPTGKSSEVYAGAATVAPAPSYAAEVAAAQQISGQDDRGGQESRSTPGSDGTTATAESGSSASGHTTRGTAAAVSSDDGHGALVGALTGIVVVALGGGAAYLLRRRASGNP